MRKGAKRMEESRPESPVPEAMGRLLALLAEQVGIDIMDRLWIFPPLVRGRKEWGLVAVSCLTEEASKRTLITGRYAAEMTGKGALFDPEFMSEGEAPPDLLPRIMDGVVRRSDLQLGVPRETEIGGDSDCFRGLLASYGWKDQPDGPVDFEG